MDAVFLGTCLAAPMIGTIGSHSSSVMNAAGVVGLVLYLMVQFQLHQTKGKTLGKLLAGTRVVRTDGTPAGLVRGWLVRGLLLNVFAVTQVLGLVNALLVLFRGRGMHDQLFDTVVVEG